MKEFNLERALAGDKVVTRDGREVTQLTQFKTSHGIVLGAIVDNRLDNWNENGVYDRKSYNENVWDLFMDPQTTNLWINVHKEQRYDDASGARISTYDACLFVDESDAIIDSEMIGFIKTFSIEVEE